MSPEDGVWHRLDPRMLLVHPVRAEAGLVPVVGLALLLGTDISDLRIVLGVVGGLLVFSVARWWSTTYCLLPDTVDQRRGVLLRRRLSVPRGRITSVDVEAPFLQRLFGLRILRLTTASSMTGHPGHSIVLNAVAAKVADQLAVDLDTRVRHVVPEPVGVGPRSTPGPHLLDWRPWWAVYAPFSAAGFVALGGLGLVVAQFVGDIGAGGAITRAYLYLDDRMGWQATIAVLASGSLLLSALLAAGNYLLLNARFTLERSGGVLRIQRGLLSRRSVTLDLGKLRGIEAQSTLPVRLLGGASTQAIVTGLGIVDQAATSVLVPLAPRRVGEGVAGSLLGEPLVAASMPRHGAAAARRRILRAVGGAGLVAGGGFAVVWMFAGDPPSVPRWLVIALLCALAAAVVVAVDRYVRLGHVVDAQWIRTREGSIVGRTVMVRADGVIGVVVRQGLTQRLSRLATLTFATAAGKQGYRVLDMPAVDVVSDVGAAGADWAQEWFVVRSAGRAGRPACVDDDRGDDGKADDQRDHRGHAE